jgi:hypothetical protein
MDIYKCPKLILPKKSWEKIKFTYTLFEKGVITSPKTNLKSLDYRGGKTPVISLFCVTAISFTIFSHTQQNYFGI